MLKERDEHAVFFLYVNEGIYLLPLYLPNLNELLALCLFTLLILGVFQKQNG